MVSHWFEDKNTMSLVLLDVVSAPPHKPLQCCLLFFPSSLSSGHILLLSVPLICQIPFDSGPLHMLFLEPRMIIILLHLFIIQFLVQRILPEESFSDSLAFISYPATVLVIACTFHLWGWSQFMTTYSSDYFVMPVKSPSVLFTIES